MINDKVDNSFGYFPYGFLKNRYNEETLKVDGCRLRWVECSWCNIENYVSEASSCLFF
jgi:hypothetical protein